ncbi:MAG: hypothetical protein KAX49_10645 [Halanaerobiales bacterium]|nr:hypothetical protein [Halanaerobiales bacterium]
MKYQIKISVVITLMLFFATFSIFASELTTLTKNEDEKRFHYELCDGKLIFDFFEPDIPQFYELSYEPDIQGAYDILEKILKNYCNQILHLEKLEQYRYEDENRIRYMNESTYLQLTKILGKVVFRDEQNKRKKFSEAFAFLNVQKFFEKLDVKLRDDLKIEYIPAIGGVNYRQFVEGVLLSKITARGIYIEPSDRGIHYFVYNILNFKKISSIPKSKVLSPLEALEKSSDELEVYYNNPPYVVTFTRVIPVYLCEDGEAIPAWEFTYYLADRKMHSFCLDVRKGGIVVLKGQR